MPNKSLNCAVRFVVSRLFLCCFRGKAVSHSVPNKEHPGEKGRKMCGSFLTPFVPAEHRCSFSEPGDCPVKAQTENGHELRLR